MRSSLFIVAALVFCISMLVFFPFALAEPGENDTVDAPGEKPVTNKTPVTPEESPVPEDTKDKFVEEREPDSFVTGEATPSTEEVSETPEMTVTTTPAVSEVSPDVTPPSNFTGSTVVPDNQTADAVPEGTLAEEPSLNTTDTLEPTVTAPVNTGIDDEDAETTPTPTLERFAPPRPGATMARAHYTHDSPLVQSGHPLVVPGLSNIPPTGNETAAPTGIVVPRDGLIVKGVAVLLDRTPEGVSFSRGGEEETFDRLLDTAMHLGGRRPRVAFEGEVFTVMVTVEARNLTVTGVEPACVVLVPPPDETGVYTITRTLEPGELRDGERGVWEFSVATRTGRLALADLTASEEQQVTNLTSNPDLFSFRAYAFAGDQKVPSVGLSDPVIAVRPGGSAETAEISALPGLYALVGVGNPVLRPSETIAAAWARGVDHDTIVASAAGHLVVMSSPGKEDVAAIYDLEGRGGEGQSSPTLSIFDLIMEFFRGLFGGAPSS